MLVIPAIDLIDGKCVRLTGGDYAQKKEYNTNPLEVAKSFADAGFSHLHVVDLDGAKQKEPVNLKVLEAICKHTNLTVDYGGGIYTTKTAQLVFDAGANQLTAGSIAVKNPELVRQWFTEFGFEKIILGADVRNNQIAISGWQEKTSLDVVKFIKTFADAQYIISTDVAVDGMLTGPSYDLYKKLKTIEGKKIIASGGVSCVDDLKKLAEIGVYGVIVGKAIYEQKISLTELSAFK